MQEVWRPVVGHEGFYEVSNFGQVRSLDGKRPHPNGDLTIRGKVLRQATHKTGGYKVVNLFARVRTVHELVLTAFVGPRPQGMLCRHLNGIPSDNRLENLMWGTPQENADDAVRHGTTPRGERHHNARLTSESVRYIRSSGKSSAELAREMGVTRGCIDSVKARRLWAHVQ